MAGHDDPAKRVEAFLDEPTIHQQWSGGYRTPENEPFFEAAFDHINRFAEAAADSPVLDAGCGSGSHSVRLVRRGRRVVGVDVSTSALRLAKANLPEETSTGRLTLTRASLADLPFDDASFPFVLCWGVLMHVPEVPAALAELARVLKPDGCLVLSEANARSLQAVALRTLRRLLRANTDAPRKTRLGMEFWAESDEGLLLTREADIPALIQLAGENRLDLVERRAGQLTEVYTRLRSRTLRRLVHRMNDFWFRRVSWPGPAFGNLIIFRKRRGA